MSLGGSTSGSEQKSESQQASLQEQNPFSQFSAIALLANILPPEFLEQLLPFFAPQAGAVGTTEGAGGQQSTGPLNPFQNSGNIFPTGVTSFGNGNGDVGSQVASTLPSILAGLAGNVEGLSGIFPSALQNQEKIAGFRDALSQGPSFLTGGS